MKTGNEEETKALIKLVGLVDYAAVIVWEDSLEQDLFSDAKSAVCDVMKYFDKPESGCIREEWHKELRTLASRAWGHIVHHDLGSKARAAFSLATLGRLESRCRVFLQRDPAVNDKTEVPSP